MKHEPFWTTQPFRVGSAVWNSFAFVPRYVRVQGPVSLVRLIQREKMRGDEMLKESLKDGQFWFSEEVLTRVRQRALEDLTAQSKTNAQPFARPISELASNYASHVLRSDLAISKDWTADFDAYVELHLQHGESLVALVGRIKEQPYYSDPNRNDPDYSAKKLRHDKAEASGVSLLGSEDQYVIDFRHADNAVLRSRIVGPFSF